MLTKILRLIVLIAFLAGCNTENEKLFTILHGNESGIDFQNTITSNDSLNALSFEYIYNGSGVGVGDFNQDGLPDLFFGGNQVTCRLYLNQSNLKFRDITELSGVTTDRWVTGVSVVDINRDGWPDVHLAVAGKTSPEKMRDLLFVNQGLKDGIPHFKELAHEYGIDDDGYGTMGAFFDYDKDGDLDLYLLTNALESFNRNNLRPKRINGEASSTDRLYRNNGNNTFTNISREAGILIEGYGLGVNICDLNQDGWPDVYVANDFMSNDLIWINQQNGTFQNKAAEYLKHQTHNGMGVDVADFNNDNLADIMVVDMLPPGHIRQKMMTAGQNYDHFHMSEQMGYQPQYMRNTLQLNRGQFSDGTVRFSEIAFLAGVAKTDWSWAPLFADFDNDGWKDLFIANGYRKDVTDLDFIFFGLKEGNPFGTPEKRKQNFYKELDKLPEVKLSNYIFQNKGGLRFEDKTDQWGIKLPTFSNGAAYADLDRDGDLDLLVNNIDQEVILYRNNARKNSLKNHFIKFQCADTSSLNQKVVIYSKDKIQFQELTPYRGFQSTVSSELHFGLGDVTQVDSVKISWMDGHRLSYYNLRTDTTVIFSYRNSLKNPSGQETKLMEPQWTQTESLKSVHKETSPSDIKITRTLLHELSRFGPCIAAADVNHDDLDDLFVGGERGSSARLFIQQSNGNFSSRRIDIDSMREDGAAHFFDADNDGDPDLYIAGCSPSSIEEASLHRLMTNDGTGNFSLSKNSLPEIIVSASCVESADYDNDGDVDLFVGGRIKPKEYPLSPRSFILRNDNGKFTDVTVEVNPDLKSPGMISSAVWADVDDDKKIDLILAGEWMPIRIFKNEGKTFREITKEFGLAKTNGWWNCLKAADLNHDGLIDIIAGNNGKNSYFQPTLDNPIQIVAKDFDKNGSLDPIITYYNDVEKDRYIIHNRMVLLDQVPMVKKRFETFTQYANTSFKKAFTDEELAGAFIENTFTLASLVLINQQGKNFELVELPEIAQISTLNDLLIEDINGDTHNDIVAIGNTYAQETLFGRYDASLGTILLGDGKFNWKNWEPRESGFVVGVDAKFLKRIDTPSGKRLVVAANNSPILVYAILANQTPIFVSKK